jgi:hypothetical protein
MCKYFLFTFLLFSLIISHSTLLAQTDSTNTIQGSEPPPKEDKEEKARKRKLNKGPRKAMFLSAVAPGLGQLYNKKYWKAPIVWAGLGVITYFYIDNVTLYRSYNNRYKEEYYIAQNSPGTPFTVRTMPDGQRVYNINQLNQGANTYRRYRDISILFGVAVYVLNIIDANVDAHLKEFDIGDELSLRVSPLLYANLNRQFTTGITLNFRFKK